MAVIAGASFVLLVTVLPQIASGFGLTSLANRIVSSDSCVGSSSSGSSGSSSMCCSGAARELRVPRAVRHGHRDRNRHRDRRTEEVHACLPRCRRLSGLEPTESVLRRPAVRLGLERRLHAEPAPGTWRIVGLLREQCVRRRVPGPGAHRDGHRRCTVHLDLTVPYEKPASLNGTITVKNVPPFDPVVRAPGVALPVLCALQRRDPVDRLRDDGYGHAAPRPPPTARQRAAAPCHRRPTRVTWASPGDLDGVSRLSAHESGCGYNANKGVTVT